MAFDIAIADANNDDILFVDYLTFATVMEVADAPYVRPLLIGSFGDALEFPLDFLTTIPSMFDLPPIDDNFAEGVVCKPVRKAINVQVRACFNSTIILMMHKYTLDQQRRTTSRFETQIKTICRECQFDCAATNRRRRHRAKHRA